MSKKSSDTVTISKAEYSGHFRFARTRKRTDHRENLYQPSKDRKGDDDKRS